MGVHAFPQGAESGEVVFVGVEEVRDREGAGHCFEHVRLDWGERDASLLLGGVGGGERGL